MRNGDDPVALRLPPYVTRTLVHHRLQMIFPDGTPNRTYCVRLMAASTVFTMLYIGAVEGTDVFLAPKHVYRMTDEQAELEDAQARSDYCVAAVKARFSATGSRWYADNTREPIRDETLREGLTPVGAVIARADLPTTSSKPRYALRAAFAELFGPARDGSDLEVAIEKFQEGALSKGALARLAIVRHGAARGALGPMVSFPSGETRRLAPGKSSTIAKAVIEVFATRFLREPAVLSLSESGNKTAARDVELAASIGLTIESDRNLPDVVLVDLAGNEPLLVFVEIVATDGPVTERRRDAILRQTDAAGFHRSRVAFLTAYEDRGSDAFRRTISSVVWGSFVWFASEPDKLLILKEWSVRTAISTLDELIDPQAT
jgi:hypothetical protein